MQTNDGTIQETVRWFTRIVAMALIVGGLGLAGSTLIARSAAGSNGLQSQTAAGAAKGLDIAFRSQPDPPKMGDNRFDVTVKGADGKPVANADVSVLFVMPAMPSMKMPEMRNEVKLKWAGGGKYSGSGQVMMAGKWDVTVVVKQKGKELGRKQVTVAAQ